MCNFRDPNLVTFYLCIYLILNEEHFTFHLQYKHSGTFANRKFEELPYPKKSGNVRPHSSNSIRKMLPHHSHSSCGNATPSSGTFPLASHKEVPPRDRTPTRNLRFKYTDKKRKQQLNSHERLRIVVVSGLSSIHDVKSEFPLSIYNHFRYSTADRMNPTARYIFVYIPSSFNKIFLLKIAYHSAIITNGSFYYCKLNR